MWNQILDRCADWIIYFCMPVVTGYHLMTGNIFLNTAAEDAHGLEYVGNVALAPFQYLFAGEKAWVIEEDGMAYAFKQHFDYSHHLFAKTAASIVALPISVCLGSALKAVSFLSPEVRERHQRLCEARIARHVFSKVTEYCALGLEVNPMVQTKITPLNYARRPGEEHHLEEAKEAVREISQLFKEHGIVFWADCGTCLGAYRYGGAIPWDNDVDLAVLLPEFDNVKRLLNNLDREKFLVEDWSNRLFPQTYIRVYIRKTRDYIDIYHYAINPENKTISYFLSNADCMFMTEGWKIREKKYTVPTPFDVVFPLKLADFDGIEVPVPNDPVKYLQLRYGDNLAPVKIYDPVSDTYVKDLSHPYWQFVNVK